VQGNLDPAVLFTNPDTIRRHAQQILESFGRGSGHVFNLGHGVSQFTPPENVAALVDAVHELSRAFH
ncbi:MAG: uroporphyrinogen decarboxylase, partial [Burkholderiales bacterium]|nr:uroporphyrinogen decarboxylase [Burkholderiales bacterium]